MKSQVKLWHNLSGIKGKTQYAKTLDTNKTLLKRNVLLEMLFKNIFWIDNLMSQLRTRKRRINKSQSEKNGYKKYKNRGKTIGTI